MIGKASLNRLHSAGMAVLSLGLFIQLSGLLFNNDDSRYATQIHLLLFLPALLLWAAEKFGWDMWRQPSAYLLLGLLGWVLLRGSLGADSDKPPHYWLKIGLFILLYVFSIHRLLLAGSLRKPLLAAIVVSALAAWLTLFYQFGVLDKALSYTELRTYGRLSELGWGGFADLSHPIIAGLYFGLFALLLLGLIVEFEPRWPGLIIAYAGLAGLLLYVLLTFSRGAWFATLAGGLVLLLLSPKPRARQLLGLGILILLAMLLIFQTELQSELRQGTSQRGPIWHNWLDRLPEFWLYGDGAGKPLVYTYPWGDTVYHAHSLYLQLWYEYGVIGAGLFAALLCALLLKGWQLRRQREARIGLAALVFAVVAMISDIYALFHRPSPYWVIVWLPIGFLIALRRNPDQTTS
ncbi:O-antigen ligase family protein [Aquipseudomonas alcaligenes]|uniref:O-Antigen ligase n=1 Tax=Aquipseudomonas alcaligenes TaxID=43263 RepID=A0A1N6XKG4_AQUAC|nr:O-antigen ligase family protein [Pseudomonas alcaligenes]SIR02719.1 O-Antigen ligase [Pseudomonas alcaligenes]